VVPRDWFGRPGVPLLIPGLHCLQVLTGSVSASLLASQIRFNGGGHLQRTMLCRHTCQVLHMSHHSYDQPQ
jgi:hypothetical protein